MKAEVVLIPSPGRGHLLATLEMAKLLINRDERLSVTVLVIKPFFDPMSSVHFSRSHTVSQETWCSRIRFIDIPQLQSPSPSPSPFDSSLSFNSHFIERHKDHVRNEVAKLVQRLGSKRRLAGFVIDLLCTSMIDVANEFGVPTYVFFTSGASVLGLMFHFQGLRDYQNQDLTAYKNSTDEILIPSYKFPVPAKLLPDVLFHKDWTLLNHAKRFRETKGIMVNTFLELEFQAIKSLSEDEKIPPIYSVGPILHHVDSENDPEKRDEIVKWLDEQPDSSVVFLCFGSRGCFDEIQVTEIALALENSGHRFLWSLRKPPGEHKLLETPGEYEKPEHILPRGFLQRTAGTGKVIGWAPQMAVLSHRAVGGFVSHCGWNSALESVWCGVPMAAWPLYAEQQANAFELVRDLGVAVEVKMEYKKGSNMMVTAEEIEIGIRRLMDPESDVMVKIEAFKVKSRMAIVKNGSSFESVGRFIDDVMVNIA